MAEWVRIAATTDCPPGKLLGRMVGKMGVALVNVDGDYYALEDRCSHQDLPLSDGEVDGSTVVCAYHGARFDACTGKNKGLPAVRPVKSFPVEVRGSEVYVDVG
ncbi:MAG: non-heme iron oxygenase ferredoxin subunit [Gemmatimonadota bacterium]|nr:non-heme iron oxygenase ferredoxin subunit [Gemmatimonadota bacterium]MDH5760970.1 non-heme iron oxygenase ferredoxin subunit [Gemmatimonadota bacterium]